MPANVSAWTALANITLSSTATTVTFSNVSQSYNDLILIVMPFGTVNNMSPFVRFNNDSGSNYTDVYLTADGATNFSNTRSSTELYLVTSGTSDTTTPGPIVCQISEYSSTTKHKSATMRNGKSNAGVGVSVGRWASTAAITSFTVNANTGSFASGATFALYGVSA